MFNVTENMLFSLNKSSTHRLPLQNAMRVQVIFLEKFARKICGDISYRYMVNAKRATVWNYQFLARGLCLSQFLARGNSCKKIFGSWWLVAGRGNQCFGSWWLVVGHGGLWWLVCCFIFDDWRQPIAKNFFNTKKSLLPGVAATLSFSYSISCQKHQMIDTILAYNFSL